MVNLLPLAMRHMICYSVAMTPEERSLLERTYKLAEENNTLLHSMRRMSRISTIARVLYWGVILVASFGAYYLIQPYVQSFADIYGQIQGSSTTSPGTGSFMDLLKQ